MILYSHNGARPAPLPFRITLPSGFTRTDPSTFTEDEIQAAGFTGPYTEPPYDPATQQLDWVDGDYVIRDLPPPPPQPQWQFFAAALATNPAVNALVSTAATQAPVLHLMLGIGMGQAAQGDPATFATAWGQAMTAGLVTADLATAIATMARDHYLPEEFIAVLGFPTLVRARDEQGRFIPDDPATPENEAWG